jgi:hypothetical protein
LKNRVFGNFLYRPGPLLSPLSVSFWSRFGGFCRLKATKRPPSPRELGNGSARQGTPLRPVMHDHALKSIRPGNWPLKKTWQPLPHQTGLLSIGISPLVSTACETLLLKSLRSKWAQINQHAKALRLSHRAELFIFGPYFFALFSGGLYARAPRPQCFVLQFGFTCPTGTRRRGGSRFNSHAHARTMYHTTKPEARARRTSPGRP